MRTIPVIGMGVAMTLAILGHLVEILVFAVALQWMVADGRFGGLSGDVQQGMRDYFYYSAITYTSLGFGDVAPTGALRLLAAVEAITGLVLIAWTASFAFLAMQNLWEKHHGES
ncbi:MAG: potassium channel family protein [Planctomycetota bacterium]|nr:potassium channel family protein [Planctomycetota bacterium]